MEMRRQTARVSIFVQMMVLAVCSSIPSSVPMGQYSISNISSVTGGSMWTVLRFEKLSLNKKTD